MRPKRAVSAAASSGSASTTKPSPSAATTSSAGPSAPSRSFAPGRTDVDAEGDLRALVDGAADIEVYDRSPSAPPFATHPLVQHLAACGVTGVAPKQAWTDVARFALHGVAAVNLGPGTAAQAHQRNEWTDRGDLQRGYDLFASWLFADESAPGA